MRPGLRKRSDFRTAPLESSNAVWYLAQDRGFYKKHGLDADLLFIPSTTTSVSSLVAGDVQVANASGAGWPARWLQEPISSWSRVISIPFL